ncbi:hypothetical protein PMI41_03027 [Phyllobacterium sp. YR531]|nr:hypothetical protein PMI41_03027 [Phyllobacterium sp. YR531]
MSAGEESSYLQENSLWIILSIEANNSVNPTCEPSS